jgi:hypothetical protein
MFRMDKLLNRMKAYISETYRDYISGSTYNIFNRMLELFTMLDNVTGLPHPENSTTPQRGEGWMLYINLHRDDRSYRREPMSRCINLPHSTPPFVVCRSAPRMADGRHPVTRRDLRAPPGKAAIGVRSYQMPNVE